MKKLMGRMRDRMIPFLKWLGILPLTREEMKRKIFRIIAADTTGGDVGKVRYAYEHGETFGELGADQICMIEVWMHLNLQGITYTCPHGSLSLLGVNIKTFIDNILDAECGKETVVQATG